MRRAHGENQPTILGPGRTIVCEDCDALREPGEPGWVRVWLEERYQPPIILTYCPRCAEQFDAYPEDASPIDEA